MCNMSRAEQQAQSSPLYCLCVVSVFFCLSKEFPDHLIKLFKHWLVIWHFISWSLETNCIRECSACSHFVLVFPSLWKLLLIMEFAVHQPASRSYLASELLFHFLLNHNLCKSPLTLRYNPLAQRAKHSVTITIRKVSEVRYYFSFSEVYDLFG